MGLNTDQLYSLIGNKGKLFSMAWIPLVAVSLTIGCTSLPSVRSAGNFLETTPLGSVVTITSGTLVVPVPLGAKAPQLCIVGTRTSASDMVDHLLSVDPNESNYDLLRFYPERLLFELEEADVCVRIDVREQSSFMSGELVVFFSPEQRLKGYWGWSSRQYSQDSKKRLDAARTFFSEPNTKRHQLAMQRRAETNSLGGAFYLIPQLPLAAEPVDIRRLRSLHNDSETNNGQKVTP